jgi:predicted nucleic acid-binding protein
MADVVLDANVLVGLLDKNDSLHQRATELLDRMQRNGDRPVMLDIMVAEIVSGSAGALHSGRPDRRICAAFVTRFVPGSREGW